LRRHWVSHALGRRSLSQRRRTQALTLPALGATRPTLRPEVAARAQGDAWTRSVALGRSRELAEPPARAVSPEALLGALVGLGAPPPGAAEARLAATAARAPTVRAGMPSAPTVAAPPTASAGRPRRTASRAFRSRNRHHAGMSEFDPKDALGRLSRAVLVVGGENPETATLKDQYERALVALSRLSTELNAARERVASAHERHVESAPGRRLRLRVIQEQELLIRDLRKAIRFLINDPTSELARRRAAALLGAPD